ncbi:trypsin-like serine peptidase [Pseudomonas putida]|uniref:Trypsin-like peptidase domain-containing protein n=1 Tax=Pseudomonas putida TaxID=303 RepID=A0A8I1JKG7_PSEPU|nr:serine protease [Pseudomonas putida]MBI6883435.1 trypsin-like peptidase domain-containing protein [Pseudomonas putida]
MTPDLERSARRMRQLLGDATETTFHEASFPTAGVPGKADAGALAERLEKDPRISALEAQALATQLVIFANAGLKRLEEGVPDWHLSDQQVSAFEAVMQVRGRPALRVKDNDVEDLDRHPGAEFWATYVDLYRNRLQQAIGATGAVRVRDVWGNAWGQGTAFLVAPDLVLSNRHVLIPPGNGQALVQRLPGALGAQLKNGFNVTIDFAYEHGRYGQRSHRVLDVPFIAAADDPVDAALLRIEPVSGSKPLVISRESVERLDYLYVIGHPGRVLVVDDKVNAVFGTLDECKRLSVGRKYALDGFDPAELVHDASTFGGYSGGPVLGFDELQVRALHYWGDPRVGNRAISATALQRHERLGPFLRQADRI